MYELYMLKKAQATICETTSASSNVEISKITPALCGGSVKGFLSSCLWTVLTLGKGRVYFIRDVQKKIIHTSYVIPRCIKFPFMKGKYDIEIGPCKTEPAYRGQGLYPYVLSFIMQNALDEKGIAYMIVSDSNTSSIRGIQKVGFTRIAQLKRDVAKRYVITKRYIAG